MQNNDERDRSRERDRNRRQDRQNRINSTSRDRSRERNDRGGRKASDRRIYVSNIPYDFRWQDLKDLFRTEVGKVAHVELFTDENDKPRGCGIVEFEDSDSVKIAVEKMHRYDIKGRKLVVKEVVSILLFSQFPYILNYYHILFWEYILQYLFIYFRILMLNEINMVAWQQLVTMKGFVMIDLEIHQDHKVEGVRI